MTSDDQHFLDFLSSITAEVTGAVEKHIDNAAIVFRQTVQSTTWIPDSIKPHKARPPPSRIPVIVHARGFPARAAQWAYDNRAFVAAALTFLTTGGVMLYRRRRAYMRKRRAKRSANGARTEVVVVSGALNSPVSRSVILDLERRGFIVYVITATAVEEEMVKAENKAAILPLHLNVADFDVQHSVDQFENFLRFPPSSTTPGFAQALSFAGLVLIPDPIYPAGPIQTISAEEWSDTLNAKVLGTIASTRAFVRTICGFGSRVVVVLPSQIASMRLPFHAPEVAVVAALRGFTDSLREELATLGLQVCRIDTGAFEQSGLSQAVQISGHETLSWPKFAKLAYAENYLAQERQLNGGLRRRKRGSHLRVLHNEIVDALTLPRPWAVSTVGRGALAFRLVGGLAPAALVRWMLGLKSVDLPALDLSDRSADSVQWERVENAV